MEQNHKPFKQYREMDDAQKQKISNNANLHKPKSDITKKKISDTMKARWAATPSKNNGREEIEMSDLVM